MTPSRQQLQYFRRARQQAENSTAPCRHGAVLVQSGRIMSMGFNRNPVAPVHCIEPPFSLHAEIDAVLGESVGGDIYVVRILRDGTLANSAPCDTCVYALRRSGIHRVYYSRGEGEYGVANLRTM